MQQRPAYVTDSEVLDAVRRTWLPDADDIEHLPVGFGAHHWVAARGGVRTLFVTLDTLGDRHSAATLTAAYDAARDLAEGGLEFVLACVAPVTTPVTRGLLSATPWRDGYSPDRVDPLESAEMLHRLHAATAPNAPLWSPIISPDLADDLSARTRRPWRSGPYGERARAAVSDRLGAIEGWVARYHHLAEAAREVPAVPTHGEPHHRNQLRTAAGTLLVDWESLKLAPAERDLRWLGAQGPMSELFDLEWRLDEIAQFATWFEQPHAGGADDETAFGGLIEELG